jgi:hypothetical protein
MPEPLTEVAHERAVSDFLGRQEPQVLKEMARRYQVLSSDQIKHRQRREVPLATDSYGQPVYCGACYKAPCICWT